MSLSTYKTEKTDSDSDNVKIFYKTQTHSHIDVLPMDNVYICINVIIEDDVIIENNCILGNNAFIKSGTIMELFSIDGAGSVVAVESLVRLDQFLTGNND